MLTKENVLKALKECYDPEIPVNIVELGLIYDVKVNAGNVYVKMTLTVPSCPMSGFITEDVRKKISSMKGVKKVDVDLVFNPPWNPGMMSKTAKKQLGI
jgi:FeS assembly SUF system protein